MGRALLIDRFLSDSNIISATEEYGLYTKQPYPDVYNLGAMDLLAGGIPTAAEDVKVKIFESGDIGTSKFLWCHKEDEAANNKWYGRNPIFHSIWEKIADNSGGTDYYEYDVIQTSAGRIFMAIDEAVGDTHTLKFYEIDRVTHAMTAVSTVDTSPKANTKVLTVYAPDHEFILVIYEHSGGNSKIKRSVDNGLTWMEIYSGVDFLLPISCAYSRNILYLAYSSAATTIRVKYSLDFGSTWATMQTTEGLVAVVSGMFVFPNGNFGMIWQTSADDKLWIYTAIPGAPFTGGTSVLIHDYADPLEAVSAEIIEGTIVVIAWDSVNFADYFLSTDDGATWSALAKLHYHTNGGIFSSIDNFKIRKVDSKPAILINGISTTYGIIWFWGCEWSNVTEIIGYEYFWDAIAEPNDIIFGWTKTTGGESATGTFESDLELKIQKTIADASFVGYVENAITPDSSRGAKTYCVAKVTAGAGNIHLINATVTFPATTTEELILLLFTNKIEVWDKNLNLRTTLNHDFTHYHEFLTAIKNNIGSVWYREIGTDEWINISNTIVLTTSEFYLSNYAMFGIYTAAIVTGYVICLYATGDNASDDDGLADGFTNPSDLVTATTTDENTFINNGVEIQFSGEDAALNDKWEVTTGYKYPKEAILTDSPGEYWRSIQDDFACYIVLDATTNSVFAVDAAGLFNVNFKTGYIELDNVSTFDSVALATISLSSQLVAGTFTSVEDDYAQDTAKALTPRIHRLDYLTASDGATYHTHQIDDNEAATVYCRGDQLAGVDGLTAGDTYSIFQNRAGGIFSTVKRYRYMRIHIPAQVTDEGYYKIGKFIAGIKYNFTKDIDWGFSDAEIPNINILESSGRQRYATKKGGTRRTVTVSWAAMTSAIVEELRGLLRYGDFTLKPAVFFRDTSDYTDVMLCRITGDYRLANIVSALQDSGVYEEWYNIEALELSEEL